MNEKIEKELLVKIMGLVMSQYKANIKSPKYESPGFKLCLASTTKPKAYYLHLGFEFHYKNITLL